MTRSIRAVLFALATALPLTGCDGPTGRITALQQQVTRLSAENDKLKLDLRATSQRADALGEQVATLNKLPADRWAAVAKPAKLVIDAKSGVRAGLPQLTVPAAASQPAAASGVFLRLYLTIQDQSGHNMHAAGLMRIAIADLSGPQPRSLGELRLDAASLERHFRTALSADLYAFDIPLAAAPKDTVTVRVEFTDYLTGQALTAEKSVK